jgi:hypothetical protein
MNSDYLDLLERLQDILEQLNINMPHLETCARRSHNASECTCLRGLIVRWHDELAQEITSV